MHTHTNAHTHNTCINNKHTNIQIYIHKQHTQRHTQIYIYTHIHTTHPETQTFTDIHIHIYIMAESKHISPNFNIVIMALLSFFILKFV